MVLVYSYGIKLVSSKKVICVRSRGSWVVRFLRQLDLKTACLPRLWTLSIWPGKVR